ncbi:hypothetical protein B0D95_00230 [Cellvibrio sp. PSBB023]|nr:hypothetical protein B0D95_00230 [Cellvibrio sp. PSBB023]
MLTEAERSLKPVTVANNENIPEGYKEDASGALRPISSIKTIDLMRDELVQKLVARATELNAQLKAFKQEALTEIAAFVELSAAEHAVKLGGQKGNVTLTSYDGAFKVLRANHDSISFNEQIHAAKELIDECLRDWTGRPGVPQGLVAAVNASFKRNAQGHLSVSRIMEMRTYDVPDDRWNRAMNIIADSIRVLGTITYLRIQKRLGRTEKYEAIPLDIAGV